MNVSDKKVLTYAAYLVLDVSGHAEDVSLLKVGEAHTLGSGELFIDLVPGLSVSGRIPLKIKD
jgi:hypothetical protein